MMRRYPARTVANIRDARISEISRQASARDGSRSTEVGPVILIAIRDPCCVALEAGRNKLRSVDQRVPRGGSLPGPRGRRGRESNPNGYSKMTQNLCDQNRWHTSRHNDSRFCPGIKPTTSRGRADSVPGSDVHHQPSVAAKMLLDWVTCDMACEKCEDSRIGVEELDCESPTEDD